ncbi:hypothetical protein CsatA_021524 [Cannabis sativa]
MGNKAWFGGLGYNNKVFIHQYLIIIIFLYSGSDLFQIQRAVALGVAYPERSSLGNKARTPQPLTATTVKTWCPPLPASEVFSLNIVINQFKSKVTSPSISSSYCMNTLRNYGYIINCECGSEVSHITEIILNKLGLNGYIDDEVGNLPWLKKLVLSDNNLQGSIPFSLGSLLHLETLDLSNNQLTGTIPSSLGDLSSLKWLYLHYNYLEGSIPSTLGKLSSLQDLYLDFNMLSGSIPDEFGSLYNLSKLQLAENRLSGSLPTTLANLINLISFWTPSNYFTGKIPATYTNLTNLRWFQVSGNELSGPLPNVKNWSKIESISVQGNNFEGEVPAEYFNLSSLQYLFISDLHNSHPFKLPHSANVSNLYTLVLRNCSITGPIPEFIGQISSLIHLDLSYNTLTGSIPESMKPNMIYMSFARNNLTGEIPRWIFQATKTRMDLSYNNFSEIDIPVPDLDLNLFACCCCQSSETTEPYMLQPPEMMKANFPGKKPKFYNLFINCGGEETNFNGTHYDADNETTRFHSISSKRNWAFSFSGDFFTTTVNTSDYYTKRVPCKISNSQSSIYESARLSPVSLNYYAYKLYKGKYNVTFHFAEIVFSKDYDRLRKRVFDVYIQGKRELRDFNIRDQAGASDRAFNVTIPTEVNNSIMHIHMYWAGKGSWVNAPNFNGPLISAISIIPDFPVGGEKLSPWLVALITVASFVIVLLLLLTIAWLMGWLDDEELKEEIQVGENIDEGKSGSTTRTTDQATEDKDEIKVPLKVLIKATKKFSEETKIGSGLLGTVYKAEMNIDKDQHHNITVAVKKLSHRYKGKINEIVKGEIYNLKSLEDKNLIRLWDAHIGEHQQLLVYEYMEKKSLASVLFDSDKSELSWKDRFDICKGIAMGLKALHKRPRGKIVHGNIKTANILLNEHYQAKLSDFGLAKVYSEEDQFSVIKAETTKGYLAPEYFQLSEPTTETDIYSFGVVLLEIVCGQQNKVRKSKQETVFLLDEVHSYREEKLLKLVDKRLEGEFKDREASNILKLAKMCTDIAPTVRPDIADIVSVLSGKKTINEIRSQSLKASNDVGADASTSMEKS